MSQRETFDLWGVELPYSVLTPEQRDYLSALPEALPDNDWVWQEIDRVWASFGLDNSKPLAGQPIGEFYSHPVWIMNGAFSASDPISRGHRIAIGEFVASRGANRIGDYGGGFGELALQIAAAAPTAQVSIIEPFPSDAGRWRIQGSARVQFVERAAPNSYDVLIAQDVLEHVEQPIGLAIALAHSVEPGGLLVFANNFSPVIQCHLPRTFHLRRTFRYVMAALGLKYEGRIRDAEHAHIYTVGAKLHPGRAKAAVTVSRVLGPLLNRI